MPRTFRPVNVPPHASPELRALAVELNRIHADIAVELARIQGLDNRVPEIFNDPKLHGHRLTDVGDAIDMHDAVTCQTLEQRYGIKFPLNQSYIETTRPIHAGGGLNVPTATESSHAVPLSQLVQTVTTITNLITNLTSIVSAVGFLSPADETSDDYLFVPGGAGSGAPGAPGSPGPAGPAIFLEAPEADEPLIIPGPPGPMGPASNALKESHIALLALASEVAF